MLYLRDLLPKGKRVEVEYRCDGPVDDYGDTEDMLFGFAIWTGETLESGDGDNYYLGDVVDRFEWEDDTHLTIWIEVVWNFRRKEEPKDVEELDCDG